MGHEALVANDRKLRAIYHNPRKGDLADAETLDESDTIATPSLVSLAVIIGKTRLIDNIMLE